MRTFLVRGIQLSPFLIQPLHPFPESSIRIFPSYTTLLEWRIYDPLLFFLGLPLNVLGKSFEASRAPP